MSNSRSVLFIVITLLMASLACALPTTISLQDPNSISTAAAQTVIAGLTESAPSATTPAAQPSPAPMSAPETITSTPTETPTGTATFTSTPTVTFTPTFTPTWTATVTLTPTSSIPQITVSVPTNCRSGPGLIYDWQGALLVGEVAQVYGRNASGNYWYIRNPDSPNNFCWVWGQYATVVGNILSLPIYAPPPTPTPTLTATPLPDFDASFSSTDNCNNNWWVEIKLKNTGSLDFKSVGMTVTDTVSGVVLADYADGFTDISGCLTSATRDTLAAGKTYVMSAPTFTYDPSGHKLRTTITLCSDLGQSGTCLTKTISFKP